MGTQVPSYYPTWRQASAKQAPKQAPARAPKRDSRPPAESGRGSNQAGLPKSQFQKDGNPAQEKRFWESSL